MKRVAAVAAWCALLVGCAESTVRARVVVTPAEVVSSAPPATTTTSTSVPTTTTTIDVQAWYEVEWARHDAIEAEREAMSDVESEIESGGGSSAICLADVVCDDHRGGGVTGRLMPTCVGDGLFAPAALNEAIGRWFPPHAWEAACDVTHGESTFMLAKVTETWCCVGPFQIFVRLHRWRREAALDARPELAGNPLVVSAVLMGPESGFEASAAMAWHLWVEQGWGPWDASSSRSDAGDVG